MSEHEVASSKDQFDRQAALYAKSTVHSQGPSLPVLIEMAQPTAQDRILDVATGTGNTAIAIAGSGAEVIGLDFSPGMLAQARARAESERVHNVRFVEGDAQALPFDDNSFTLVVVRCAPHHFHDVPKFLAEVKRVLVPGGRFVMSDGICPSGEALDWLDRWQRLRDPSHFYARTPDQWRELATSAGFNWIDDTLVPYRLEFNWWVRQAGASEQTIQTLREHAKQATETIRVQMGMEFGADGEVSAYLDPMLVVRLEPRA